MSTGANSRRASLGGADQQSRRDLARIDGEIVEPEQRGVASDAEAIAQRGAVEKQSFRVRRPGAAPPRAVVASGPRRLPAR